MTSGPTFSDAQLKLWLRRVETEMSKGTEPEAALNMVKAAMSAQTAGQSALQPAEDLPQKNDEKILERPPRPVTFSSI